MRYTTAGLLLLSAVALLAGCASHPAYYVAPPPPQAAYAEPLLMQTAHQNGFADGLQNGERDRVEGHSFRPTYSNRYANTPGYSSQLGGPFWQYQSAYRDAYVRGYGKGYQRG
ncbi:MAG: hypothetical protein WA869_28290 [Alloacidobacterium sp.]|jgi:hypothetical protein